MPHRTPYPADALATVLDPSSVDCHPALMHDAWARLKEARGEPVARPHLMQARHLIGPAHVPAPPRGPVALLCEAHGQRAIATVRRLIAEGRVTPTPGPMGAA